MSSTTRTTLTCRDVRQAMVPFFEGTVPAQTREALIAHLRRCRRCHLIYEEAAAVRRLLSGDSTPGDFPPDGLADRIKRAAREAHDDAQVRSGKAVTVIGSPAFVATCASLLIGAFMTYAMTTQVYERRLDVQMAANTRAIEHAPFPARSVEVAGLAAPPMRPSAVVPAASFVPFASFAMAPEPAAQPEASPAPRHARALSHTPRQTRAARPVQSTPAPPVTPRVAFASATVTPPCAPPAAPPSLAPHRNPVVAVAAASVAGVATRAALLRASRAAVAVPHPLATERVAMAPVAPASTAASGDASAGLAAGLVAHYVVERYVAERLAQSAPTLTMAAATRPATLVPASLESGR